MGWRYLCDLICNLLFSKILMCHRVLYSSAFEYYTQVPSSTILKCHRVLYSSAFEYYTQVPLSTILKCHWVLYSCAFKKLYFRLEYGYMRWFFYWNKLFHSPPKMILLYKIDAIFINITTLICIIYTNPHHLSPTFSSLPPNYPSFTTIIWLSIYVIASIQ